jgi:hypothetical protein
VSSDEFSWIGSVSGETFLWRLNKSHGLKFQNPGLSGSIEVQTVIFGIVTYRPIAGRRLGKHILSEATCATTRRLLLGNGA